jgi:NADP-dependent 3-hydroxy acid dehydrogenase YdfG
MSSPPDRKRAIITGASSGIGKATALAFAKAGIHLALVGRAQEKLEAVAKAATEVGVEAKTYLLDLAKLEEVKSKMAAIAADFGEIDILVNSAGIALVKPLEETSLADWQQVIDLNLSSVFQCILGVLPGMRDRAQGSIVNVASIAAETPFPGWGAYCVSKAGLVTLSKVLAAEERAKGIRVTSISPGAVNTALWDSETVQGDFNRSAMLNPDTVARAILHTALLPAEAVVEQMTIMPSAGAL